MISASRKTSPNYNCDSFLHVYVSCLKHYEPEGTSKDNCSQFIAKFKACLTNGSS